MTNYKTIRHAIEKECRRISLTDWCENWGFTTDDFDKYLDAADNALRTRQEHAQREQGCEYCDFSSGGCGAILDGADSFFLMTSNNSYEFYIATDGKGVFRETKIKFCPMCGRKLVGGEKCG